MPLSKPLPGALWRPRGGIPQPVFAWLGNPGSGLLAQDQSGNQNHGTLTGMNPATDWVGTPYGGGLDFDGANDCVDCLRHCSPPTVRGSFFALVKPTTLATAFRIYMSSQQANYIGHFANIATTGLLWFSFGNNSSDNVTGRYSVTGSTVMVADTWYAVGGSWDNLTVGRLYVNGAPEIVTYSGTAATYVRGITGAARIGGWFVGSTYSYATGQIAALMVWHDALPEAAFQQLAANTFAGWGPDTRWWYAAGGGAGAQTITLAGIASSGALGAVTVSPGVASAILAGIASGAVLGTVVVSPGAVSAILSGIASPGGVGAVALTPGTAGIALSGISGPDVLGAVILVPGGVSALLDGISAGRVLGSVILTPGAVFAILDGIAGPDVLGSLTVTLGAISIALDGIGSNALLGSLTATPGAVTISLDGIPSGAVLGTIKVAIAGVGFVFLPLINRTFERVGPSMAGRL